MILKENFMKKTALAFVVSMIIFILDSCPPLPQEPGWNERYSYDFESGLSGWDYFEEIVNGDTENYGDNIGLSEISTEAANSGSNSLCVWANYAGSDLSNHLIGNYPWSMDARSGIWRYEVTVLIPPADGQSNQLGQTGPEFSLQNTREISAGEFRTFTAGIQYCANPGDPVTYQNWYAWDNAGWVLIGSCPLSEETWYTLALEMDYDTNSYIAFEITNGTVTMRYDISTMQMTGEEKEGFDSEGFWLTCETENMWGEDGSEYRIFYDDVLLLQWH